MKALEDEMTAYATAVRQRHLDGLRAAGVTGAALVEAWQHSPVPPIGIAAGAVAPDGTWEPREVGEDLLVTPITSDGEVIDLVAWRPTDLRRLWLRRGDAELLGWDAAERAAWFTDPLKVFETPLAWLAAGAQGAVVLRWPAGAWWLRGLRLVADTRTLAARLDAAINSPAAPTEIFVRTAA